MSEPTFKNACDYHIAQPSSLSTSAHAAAAKRSASCRACSIECSLQNFGKADRAECLKSCDPSPVEAGSGATNGAQYPDPLAGSQFDDIRDTYIPRVTALTCPSSSCSDGTSTTEAECSSNMALWTVVNNNDGRFAGSVRCRPFTDAMRDEVLAAASESAMDGCGAMKSRGFKCDLDCDTLDYDACNGASNQFCKWTIPEGGNPDEGSCSTRTAESARAINMCSTGDDACAEGSAMLNNTEGEPCTIFGSSADRDEAGVYGFDDKGLFRCIAADAAGLVRLNACPNNEPFC